MSNLKTYLIIFYQDEGCDYTIGCGTRVEKLQVQETNGFKLHNALVEYIWDQFSHIKFSKIEAYLLDEFSETLVNLNDINTELYELRYQQNLEVAKQKELKLYKKLHAKYGDS